MQFPKSTYLIFFSLLTACSQKEKGNISDSDDLKLLAEKIMAEDETEFYIIKKITMLKLEFNIPTIRMIL